MSGNQYVYSIEIYRGAVFSLDLVTHNRKMIRARVARLISSRERTHEVTSSTSHRDLSVLMYTHGGKRAVCDRHFLMPRPEYKGTTGIEIIVKAWIIKAAKPEGPVRGTLKERMGDRAWKPTHLDVDRCPPEEKYPNQPPDGRVT